MSEITVPHIKSPYPFEAYAHVVEPVRLMQRLPRSLHANLVAHAKAEVISLNTMVIMLLAEGL